MTLCLWEVGAAVETSPVLNDLSSGESYLLHVGVLHRGDHGGGENAGFLIDNSPAKQSNYFKVPPETEVCLFWFRLDVT